MDGPTDAQIDRYRHDGFLIVERFLEPDSLDGVRDRFAAVFDQGIGPAIRQVLQSRHIPARGRGSGTRGSRRAW